MQVILSEKEVEDEIFYGQLLSEYGIKCIARQVRMGIAGIVDILGYDRSTRQWVLIEIKKDQLNPQALAQCMRYQYWFEAKLKKRPRRTQHSYQNSYCLIIGSSLEDSMRFLPNLSSRVDDHQCCYTIYRVRPELSINWSSVSGVEYSNEVEEETHM